MMLDQIHAMYPGAPEPLDTGDALCWDRPPLSLAVYPDGSWIGHLDPGLAGLESGPDLSSAANWFAEVSR